MTIEKQVELWRWLQGQAFAARSALTAAEGKVKEFEREHMRNYPLSAEVVEQLRQAVRAETPLCCSSGQKLLDTIVDPIWSEHLNGWAYEALGCSKGRDAADDLNRLNEHLRELESQ